MTDRVGDEDASVRAAGGVVLSDDGSEVLVVHRPAHDDWSLPKGKLDPGESWHTAAVREIAEETGVDVELGPELTPSRYVDGHGRPKVVRWWLMRARDAHPRAADDEVDEVRWVGVAAAPDLLTYPSDRELVAQALASRADAPWDRPGPGGDG